MKKMNYLLVSLISFSAYAADGPVMSVVVENVQVLNVGEPVTFNGIVRSRSDIALPATVDGELMWVLDEGQVVKSGGVVAKVDDRQLKLLLQEQTLLTQRSRINIQYLQGEVDRLSLLQQANLAAKTQLAELVSRRDLAKNDLLVGQSRLAQLNERLARTEIISPVDAVVIERLIQGGEFARRGESVVRILDPSSLEIQVSIPVSFLNRLDRNMDVSIMVQDTQFEAPMRSLIQAGDRSSQTFDILVAVPQELAAFMVAGQFADATVSISERRTSLFVPRDAVVLRIDGNYVFTIEKDNTARRVTVILGDGQGDMVSVNGDLQEGDRVAVRGVERLADGQAVSPTT